MYKKFSELPRIAQIILLILPIANFVIEVAMRYELYSENKSNGNLLMFILSIFTFGYFGLLDIIWLCLNNDIFKVEALQEK